MTATITGKLVRDRIPDLCRANGQHPITGTASDDGEYRAWLRAKLCEEVTEYLDSGEPGDPGELADIMEVVHALAALDGVTVEQVEQLRAAKEQERGGFVGRVIWHGNRVNEDGKVGA